MFNTKLFDVGTGDQVRMLTPSLMKLVEETVGGDTERHTLEAKLLLSSRPFGLPTGERFELTCLHLNELSAKDRTKPLSKLALTHPGGGDRVVVNNLKSALVFLRMCHAEHLLQRRSQRGQGDDKAWLKAWEKAGELVLTGTRFRARGGRFLAPAPSFIVSPLAQLLIERFESSSRQSSVKKELRHKERAALNKKLTELLATHLREGYGAVYADFTSADVASCIDRQLEKFSDVKAALRTRGETKK